MPAQIPVVGLRQDRRDTGPEVGRGQHVHHRVAICGAPITPEDRRRQNLLQVLRPSRRHHDPTLGHLDRHVVATVPEVELGVAQERVRLPALDVVVHRHLRIPVGDVEQVVLAPTHAATGAALRDLEGPVDLQHHRVARHQEPAGSDVHGRALNGVAQEHPRPGDLGQRLAVGDDPAQLDPPGHLRRAIPHHTLRVQVLQKVQHQVAQPIRRSVAVDDAPAPLQPLLVRDDAGAQGVVGPLLPVVGAGYPGGGSRSLLDGASVIGRRHDRVRGRPTAPRLRRQRRRRAEREGRERPERGSHRFHRWLVFVCSSWSAPRGCRSSAL